MTFRFARTLPAVTLLAACLISGPAAAISTNWEETDGGRLRIVAGPVDPEGNTARGFLEIDLRPGWKTYWLEPGSSGIPPSVEISGGVDVDRVDLDLPAPHWIESESGDFAGYKEPVRFPLTFHLSPGAAKGMAGTSVFVGICAEICIPAAAEFVIPLTPSGDDALANQVDAAFGALPGPDLAVENVEGEADGSLIVTLSHPPLGDAEPVLFAADAAMKVTMAHPDLLSRTDGQSRFRLRPAHDVKSEQVVDMVLVLSAGDKGVKTVHQLTFPAMP